MDTVTFFRRAAEQFGEAVHQVKPDQWTAPTPCTEWDVRALVRHLVYECLWMPPLFEGETIQQVGDRFEGEILGDDPASAYDEAAREAIATVEKPGAMQVTAQLSFGPTPGEEYATQVLFDLFVHGWDLRTAIGLDSTMDPEILTAITPWAERTMDAYRAAGVVAPPPPIPDGANEQTRLLALTGRGG